MGPRSAHYYEMCRKLRLFNAVPKVWNYIKYRCLRRKATMSIRRYAPQIACLWVTQRCNLKCEYCASGKILRKDEGERRKNEATLEKTRRIFTNPLFENCLLVDLEGGEPLLASDLDRIVSYLVKRGHIVNISTNGLLLADRIADLKRAGVSRVNVSLYDANQSVLEGVLPKINRVFPVHTSFVLLRSKVEREQDKILERVRFVHDAGCRGLRFFIYRLMGVDIAPEEIINDTLPAYIELRRRIEESMPGFCLWPPAIQTGGVKKLCPQLWQRITCDASGNIMICCGINKMLEGVNSNLFDSEPDVIFNHPTLVGMREQLLDPERDPPEACKTCNLLGDPGW